MKKPPWKNAPDWAEWRAMDYDEDWYWYADKPTLIRGLDGDEWCVPGGSKYQLAQDGNLKTRLKNSLEKRPSK